MNSMNPRGVCFREAFVVAYSFVVPKHEMEEVLV